MFLLKSSSGLTNSPTGCFVLRTNDFICSEVGSWMLLPFYHHSKMLSVATAVNLIIRPNLRRFCELYDTQIGCTDKEGTVTEATFELERAEGVTAD